MSQSALTVTEFGEAPCRVFDLERSTIFEQVSSPQRIAAMVLGAGAFVTVSLFVLRFDTQNPIATAYAWLGLIFFGGGSLVALIVAAIGRLISACWKPAMLQLRLDDRGITWTTARAKERMPIVFPWSSVARFVALDPVAARNAATSATPGRPYPFLPLDLRKVGFVPVNSEAALTGLARGASILFGLYLARYGALPIGRLKNSTIEDAVAQLEAIRAAHLART